MPVLVEGTTLHVIQIVPDQKSGLFMQGRRRFAGMLVGAVGTKLRFSKPWSPKRIIPHQLSC